MDHQVEKYLWPEGYRYVLVWKIEGSYGGQVFFQFLVDPCVWYSAEMVLLLYLDDYLMFSPSMHKIDDFYASLKVYFKMKDTGDLIIILEYI